jgi:hypothetical protein
MVDGVRERSSPCNIVQIGFQIASKITWGNQHNFDSCTVGRSQILM